MDGIVVTDGFGTAHLNFNLCESTIMSDVMKSELRNRDATIHASGYLRAMSPNVINRRTNFRSGR